MRPKILLLDEPHPKARAIMEEVADLYTPLIEGGNIRNDTIIWTGLTPVETNCVVACPCTGIDHIKALKVIYLDEQWKANEGREVTSTAEHTFRLILELAKMNRMQLKDKHLGIIGYGRIGQQVDIYGMAFGMRVHESDKDSGWPLEILLQMCDIITLHVPLNSETRGLISEKEFAMMKPGALLINTSRQAIIDIDALKENLINSKVKYADDFKNDVDLTEYGAIQTEHIAGNTIESRILTDVFIARKVVEYIKEGLL